MLRRRARRVLAKVRRELHEALQETHTPRQVAASFALGIFITALPTLGTGVLLFFLIAYLVSNVSRIALFASVIVLNPVVKWGVYGASFWLGRELLGPTSVTVETVSLSAGPQIVARLLVGNLILAVVFTVVAYVVGYRLTVEYRRRAGEVGLLERYFEGFLERLPSPEEEEVAPVDDEVAPPEDESAPDADGDATATDGGHAADSAPDRQCD